MTNVMGETRLSLLMPVTIQTSSSTRKPSLQLASQANKGWVGALAKADRLCDASVERGGARGAYVA